ncbi:MAG: fibronectin type III domain-containing protein [bacterium]|nr:fibronectin type III domain-containing protein [bacterium]
MKKIYTWLTAIVMTGAFTNPVFATEGRVNVDGKAKIEVNAGIQKRLENGKGLPPGIAKKIKEKKKSDDTTAPTLGMILAVERAQKSARIIWATDERADGKVWMSTSSPVDTSGAPRASSKDRDYFHRFALKDLTPGTKYYFVVASADASGNTTRSSEQSFTTESAQATDTRAPAVLMSWTDVITPTSVRVSWVADEKVSGKVLVSTVSPVLENQSRVFEARGFSLHHTAELTGLTPNTAYFYVVKAVDASGNIGVSEVRSFTTASADAIAPIIFGPFAIQVGKDGARIIWSTDERANGKVWVSASSPVDRTGTPSASNTALTLFHDFSLSGLASNTLYRVMVSSTDVGGNVSLSQEATFTTTAP